MLFFSLKNIKLKANRDKFLRRKNKLGLLVVVLFVCLDFINLILSSSQTRIHRKDVFPGKE